MGSSRGGEEGRGGGKRGAKKSKLSCQIGVLGGESRLIVPDGVNAGQNPPRCRQKEIRKRQEERGRLDCLGCKNKTTIVSGGGGTDIEWWGSMFD